MSLRETWIYFKTRDVTVVNKVHVVFKETPCRVTLQTVNLQSYRNYVSQTKKSQNKFHFRAVNSVWTRHASVYMQSDYPVVL
jgi:hypothetical protein